MGFTKLGLSKPILKAIQDQGYDKPTPIQKQSIPIILKQQDVLAGAQTGTGKTAGFTLPMLELLSKKNIKKRRTQVRALVLTPTRELAAQVYENVDLYSKYLPLTSAVVFGGVSINPQKSKLKNGLDILVATPGRLLDLIGQDSCDLSQVEFLVLDEADRMLDMGFINDIKKILAMLPSKRQNLLFSATFSTSIKNLADKLLNEPVLIEVAKRNQSSHNVTQAVHFVDKRRKQELLMHLILDNDWTQVLIFARTKHGANKLSQNLEEVGITSAAIHGNKSQSARTKALASFKDGTVRVLVATDIAARGIDIDQLPHVINYELPDVAEDYVHRIGRTGRAGHKGDALSLVCIDEMPLLKDIQKLIKKEIPQIHTEGFKVDPTIKAEPKKKPQGRGQRSGNRSNGNGQQKKSGSNGDGQNRSNNRNRSRNRNRRSSDS
ncbi:MAG: DEAD/DEAH box helicase [Campylobacteraceae bacterium]|jgi:ATP-dependent RNA helicase RhlE|nr:DEAD/DEAH box helicase [Campylobacteraceae bacterium]MBT3882339.1 DEAD/DEAH box helicase [Campylobacteraceae bacterium]MBT4030940.1 DEAD/DEAH box helicase [Campylobacteraceae bacterium]MBT4179003.1 DEAD/DEAH box helicase [Campylobacteraceae bacterium]MBT4572022.1 DEAD/DEAH box helicase [Campylobacteraceae bacterium]